MSRHRVVPTEEVFYYAGREDYDELIVFLRSLIYNPEGEYQLQRDGSLAQWDYREQEWVYHPPGSWWTRSFGTGLSDAEFRRLMAPVPSWPDEEGTQ